MTVSKENVSQIIRALELEKIVHEEEAQWIVLRAEGQRVTFKQFSEDLIELMDSIVDEDFAEIVNSYSVPAERIIRFLTKLKERHLKGDAEMQKEADFAIAKILERSIFEVD